MVDNMEIIIGIFWILVFLVFGFGAVDFFALGATVLIIKGLQRLGKMLVRITEE